jgi:hypothetical protein
MKTNRRRFIAANSAALAIFGQSSRILAQAPGALKPAPARQEHAPDYIMPMFEPVQPDLFSAAGAQPNCWADFDGDGDLDLFVGFRAGLQNRLYRNDGGTFQEVSKDWGVADLTDTRAASWGDFDSDGKIDLFVGFTRKSSTRGKLYHNDGSKFVDVAGDLGFNVLGETRQVSFIDFDNDGRMDIFVAFRDAPNMLFHNEGNRFVDVAGDLGVADPRKTVGAVWFDYNLDGRLDVFTANQDGTLNGFFRNDGNRFVDVAHEMGMDAFGRPSNYGSNGPGVIDFDNDGNLDLFVAGYGVNFLFKGDGRGSFQNVAAEMGVMGGDQATPSAWGDYDNDGRPDLYVSSYLLHPLNEHDHFYRNSGNHFSEVIPWQMLRTGATHGIQWADFDGNGALDFAVANNNPNGHHYLWRNLLPPERAGRSLQVMVVDDRGRYTKAGSEVRIYAPGTRQVLGTRIVDTGGGYCSQNVAPVHFGLPTDSPVDIEITSMTKTGRKIMRVPNADPARLSPRVLTIKVSES